MILDRSYSLADEHVFELEIEHFLAVECTQTDKISKLQGDIAATAREWNAKAVILAGRVHQVLFHVLALHESKGEQELARRLLKCLVANNKPEPPRSAVERERNDIRQLNFQ